MSGLMIRGLPICCAGISSSQASLLTHPPVRQPIAVVVIKKPVLAVSRIEDLADVVQHV